ncbi:hypothetical protein [Vitiosangium sp. GDMCC 1.1324]|uniref:hypothetical protein n=1 Tax=Vitiosangium sp. (strain GDMCC 1.1324) TaxID=2138576 RepID=UPI001E57123A|nr:hypothetical protein [Vitiosangium sp. GDMCC 1.1324]
MSTDVKLVASGARAPVGTTAESVAAAVRAGISRVRRLLVPELGRQSASFLARDALLDPGEWSGAARMAALGAAALAEVLGKLAPALTQWNAEVPVLVGFHVWRSVEHPGGRRPVTRGRPSHRSLWCHPGEEAGSHCRTWG